MNIHTASKVQRHCSADLGTNHWQLPFNGLQPLILPILTSDNNKAFSSTQLPFTGYTLILLCEPLAVVVMR